MQTQIFNVKSFKACHLCKMMIVELGIFFLEINIFASLFLIKTHF